MSTKNLLMHTAEKQLNKKYKESTWEQLNFLKNNILHLGITETLQTSTKPYYR